MSITLLTILYLGKERDDRDYQGLSRFTITNAFEFFSPNSIHAIKGLMEDAEFPYKPRRLREVQCRGSRYRCTLK